MCLVTEDLLVSNSCDICFWLSQTVFFCGLNRTFILPDLFLYMAICFFILDIVGEGFFLIFKITKTKDENSKGD